MAAADTSQESGCLYRKLRRALYVIKKHEEYIRRTVLVFTLTNMHQHHWRRLAACNDLRCSDA